MYLVRSMPGLQAGQFVLGLAVAIEAIAAIDKSQANLGRFVRAPPLGKMKRAGRQSFRQTGGVPQRNFALSLA